MLTRYFSTGKGRITRIELVKRARRQIENHFPITRRAYGKGEIGPEAAGFV